MLTVSLWLTEKYKPFQSAIVTSLETASLVSLYVTLSQHPHFHSQQNTYTKQ